MIPVNKPLLLSEDKLNVSKVIEEGWISSEGKEVKKFENLISNYIGHKFGIAVSSGTAALEIALKVLDLKETDEVIMPSHTIISCAQAIYKTGAKIVLVDSDYTTWNMKVEDIEEKISENTKVILVPHLYGLPVDMDPILKLVKKYNLILIEDNSQMLGQNYKNKKCGSFGDITTFSFYPNKIITTGEGGMCTTTNEDLYKKLKYYRNLCFDENPYKRFIHEDIGWNYRMTNLQAALGVSQFKRIDFHIKRKREIGLFYNILFDNEPILKEFFNLPLEKTDYAKNIYWVYGLVIKDKYSITSLEFIDLLRKKGIGARPFFYPIHLQPVFLKKGLFKDEKYPIAEKLYNKGFYIPSGLGISFEEMEKVVNAIKDIVMEII